jgi:plasmid replication initiation protein
LISWRATGKTPIIKLEELRNKLGVGKDEYLRMDNFKRIVLNPAIEQVSEHTNIKAVYEQHKKGRVIEGFSFAFKTKKKAVDKGERDPNTADMFTKLTDKQLARIVHSKKFINDYNGLVSAQNPANQSSGAWVAHMVEWLKKDPSNFAKRPMQEYLDDEQAQRF